MDISKLTTPATIAEIEWRTGMQAKSGDKILVMPYLTNRAVMTRLDDACTPFGWSSKLEEVADGFLCTLSIKDDQGEWVSKVDGASRTDIEGLKGGASGAMKRAAVQWGIGRDLYDFPKVYIETTEKYIPNWAFPLLDKMVEKINAGGTVRDVVVLKATHAQPAAK